MGLNAESVLDVARMLRGNEMKRANHVQHREEECLEMPASSLCCGSRRRPSSSSSSVAQDHTFPIASFRSSQFLNRLPHLSSQSLSPSQHLSLYFSKKRPLLFHRMTDSELMQYFSTLYLVLLFSQHKYGQAERLLRHEFFLFHNWFAVLDLLRVYAHSGDLDKLEQLWMFYLEANRGRIHEDYDISGLYSNKNWMRKLGKEVKDLKSIRKQRVDLMNCVLHALMRRVEHRRAQSLFDEWQKDGLQPNKETIMLMMKSYCMTKEPKLARDLIKRYFEGREDADLVTALIHTHVISGDPDKAKRVFLKYTLRDAKNLNPIVPDAAMVCKLIQGYAMCGRMREAKRWFCKYFSDEESIFEVDASVLHIMIYGYSRLGYTEEAEQLLKEHVLLSGKISIDIRMITSLIAGYTKTGQVHEAVSLFETYCVPLEERGDSMTKQKEHNEDLYTPEHQQSNPQETGIYLAPTADTKIQLSAVMKHLDDLPEDEANAIHNKLKIWL